jgi:replication initiation and membrane attachment protein
MFWQEIQFCSRQERPLDATDILSLTHLYQPIVGSIGVGLYVTLHSQAVKHGISSLLTHTYLFKLLAISHNQLLEARYQLEGAGLLRTFEKEDQQDGNYLEYQIVPPLSPLTFFQTNPLAIQLKQQLGDGEYQLAKDDLLTGESHTASINLTKTFHEVYGQIQSINETPSSQLLKQSIDMGFVRSCLATAINPSDWNSQLESELQQACYLFNLDEQGLVKALKHPEVSQHGHVHLEKLFNHLNATYHPIPDKIVPEQTGISDLSPEDKHFQLLSTISPFELLAHYQGGAAIPKSEMDMVRSLIEQYHLLPCVVNVLLDFVLIKCDRKLPRPYVEKIASHWKRLNIKTVDQAKAQALKENNTQHIVKQAKEPARAKKKQPINKLPKSITHKIVQPEFTAEELKGTIEDIHATMELLRSTEKQVLHNKE